jgi:hypothetical protein
MFSYLYAAYDFPIIHNFQTAINLANQENAPVKVNVLDIEVLVEPQSKIHDLLCLWEQQLEIKKKR